MLRSRCILATMFPLLVATGCPLKEDPSAVETTPVPERNSSESNPTESAIETSELASEANPADAAPDAYVEVLTVKLEDVPSSLDAGGPSGSSTGVSPTSVPSTDPPVTSPPAPGATGASGAAASGSGTRPVASPPGSEHTPTEAPDSPTIDRCPFDACSDEEASRLATSCARDGNFVVTCRPPGEGHDCDTPAWVPDAPCDGTDQCTTELAWSAADFVELPGGYQDAEGSSYSIARSGDDFVVTLTCVDPVEVGEEHPVFAGVTIGAPYACLSGTFTFATSHTTYAPTIEWNEGIDIKCTWPDSGTTVVTVFGMRCESESAACHPARDPRALCGDEAVSPDEECDDGNVEDGDGCSSKCFVETGFSCPAPGKACVTTNLPEPQVADAQAAPYH